MIVVHVPIFIAIVEYGIILTFKKYRKLANNMKETMQEMDFKINEFSKKSDKITFIICFTFIVMFNVFYWFIALQK